jgi:hypothetical protein
MVASISQCPEVCTLSKGEAIVPQYNVESSTNQNQEKEYRDSCVGRQEYIPEPLAIGASQFPEPAPFCAG